MAVADCSGALREGSGVVMWAEVSGEGGAGEFGVAGRSEAIRGLGCEVVRSARTNAVPGYPLMTRDVSAAMIRRRCARRGGQIADIRWCEAIRSCKAVAAVLRELVGFCRSLVLESSERCHTPKDSRGKCPGSLGAQYIWLCLYASKVVYRGSRSGLEAVTGPCCGPGRWKSSSSFP